MVTSPFSAVDSMHLHGVGIWLLWPHCILCPHLNVSFFWSWPTPFYCMVCCIVHTPSISALWAFDRVSPLGLLEGPGMPFCPQAPWDVWETRTPLASLPLLRIPTTMGVCSLSEMRAPRKEPEWGARGSLLGWIPSAFPGRFSPGKSLGGGCAIVSVFKSGLSADFFDGSISYARFDLASEVWRQ